jgi:molybdate transport system substrate-binding protein
MRKLSLAAVAATIGLSLLQSPGAGPQAAEIKVIVADIMAGVLGDLGPQFESASGHKLVVKSGLAVVLMKEIQAGEPVDLVIFPTGILKNPANQASFAAGTLTDVAKVGQGVAVRAGAPKPDISSVDKFKQTLLNAKSVAFVPEGLSGIHTLKVFERLGISDEMKAKIKPQKRPPDVAPAVANGEAELALFLTNLVVSAPGVELVGTFPAELQEYIVFAAAVGASAAQAEPAKALIKHLTAPAAAGAIKARGMEPAAP